MPSTTVTDFTDTPPTGTKTVLLFWAPWHEASTGPMEQVLQALAASNSTSVSFGRVQAEEHPELSKKYKVTVVPTFVLLDAAGNVVERIEGGTDVGLVTQAVQRLQESSSNTTATKTEESPKQQDALSQRLSRLIQSSEVMLFIKGTPDAPRCGFSRQAVELLQDENIPFGSFDILTDETVRQGLKTYSDWPTYPQIYVKGELQGGLDILKELKADGGSLREEWELATTSTSSSTTASKSLEDRLKELTHRHKVVLFMKGLPSTPKCGFSQQMVEILQDEDVAFDSFDILQDEEVRQGLKTYSDWPTYPQLYVDGDLIGGLDIVKELKADGSLRESLGV